MFSSYFHRIATFWAFLPFSDLVADYLIAEAFYQPLVAVWTAGVFVPMSVDISDVWIEDSHLSSGLVRLLKDFNLRWRIVKSIGWIIPREEESQVRPPSDAALSTV